MAEYYEWKVKVEIDPASDCGDDRVVQQRFSHVFTVASDRPLCNTDVIIEVLDQMEVE